jgi:hypothetical protein
LSAAPATLKPVWVLITPRLWRGGINSHDLAVLSDLQAFDVHQLCQIFSAGEPSTVSIAVGLVKTGRRNR